MILWREKGITCFLSSPMIRKKWRTAHLYHIEPLKSLAGTPTTSLIANWVRAANSVSVSCGKRVIGAKRDVDLLQILRNHERESYLDRLRRKELPSWSLSAAHSCGSRFRTRTRRRIGYHAWKLGLAVLVRNINCLSTDFSCHRVLILLAVNASAFRGASQVVI